MSLYLHSLAEVKALLQIPDDQDDALLLALGEGLQGRFDAHCDRRLLYSAAEVEYFNGGTGSLYLRRFPVESVTDVIVDSEQLWEAEDALDASSWEYMVDLQRGRLVYGSGGSPWPAGFNRIRVRYAGGLVKADGSAAAGTDAADLAAIRRAFALQLGYEWRNRLHLGVQSVSGQGVAVSGAPADLLPEVKAILNIFRRV